MTNPNLEYYKKKRVKDLLVLPPLELCNAIKERHRIFAYLLMALVHYHWTPMKRGRNGKYPLSARSLLAVPYGQRDYIGHNIAALAVNDKGQVVDFEFNHNRIFNSSAEHAEARLIRRIYGLSQVMDAYSGASTKPVGRSDYDTFEDITIYTSLEPCFQCSGMMALARVKEVVYLQSDPGMNSIGNILHNLTRRIPEAEGTNDERVAPLPIHGSLVTAESAKLESAFERFEKGVLKSPFFIPNDDPSRSDLARSITSFLCTDGAFDIFSEARRTFDGMKSCDLGHGTYLPKAARCRHAGSCGPIICGALSNEEALDRARGFFHYATSAAKRGTPHP